MFKLPSILISGEITDETLDIFDAKLSALEVQAIQAIRVDINSPGGIFEAGMAIATRMRNSPIKTYTYNLSYAGSSALIVFSAGDFRIAAPFSQFMFHSISLQPAYSTVVELERSIKNFTKDNDRMMSIINKYSGLSIPIMKSAIKSEKDYNFDAKQALKMKFIHKIA